MSRLFQMLIHLFNHYCQFPKGGGPSLIGSVVTEPDDNPALDDLSPALFSSPNVQVSDSVC